MKLPELVRKAVEIGKVNGTITFDQLNELIASNLGPEDIENLLQALRNEGIDVVEATNTSLEMTCSFCGKSQAEVLQLIAGPSAFICNECVQLSVGISAPSAEHEGAAFEQKRVGLHHLCFRARERADIDELHVFLGTLGTKIIRAPREDQWAPGYYSILFEDPDGIRLELNHVPGKGLLG